MGGTYHCMSMLLDDGYNKCHQSPYHQDQHYYRNRNH